MKKLIIYVSLLVCFWSYIISVSGVQTNNIIVIDAGHGGMDGGATVDGIKESTLTLEVSLKLKEVLESEGFEVIMTRTQDVALCEGEFVKKEDMQNRVQIINRSNARFAISIHMNKFSVERYRGAQVFYSNVNASNLLLAETMQQSLSYYLGNTTRQIVYRDNIFLLNKAIIPCCIIECGFMSNKEELSLLIQDDYQYKLCRSILYACNTFLKMR